MYMLLAKEVADVDSAFFEMIGTLSDEVLAAPNRDQIIALKGSATGSYDDITDCQNTLFLHWNADVSRAAYAVRPLEPGALYRYRGDQARYKGMEFVELKYEHELGAVTLTAYFLVAVRDCEFAVFDEELDEWFPHTLLELWDKGHIRQVNNG